MLVQQSKSYSLRKYVMIEKIRIYPFILRIYEKNHCQLHSIWLARGKDEAECAECAYLARDRCHSMGYCGTSGVHVLRVCEILEHPLQGSDGIPPSLATNIIVSSMLILGGSATVTDLTGMSTIAVC